MDDLPEPIKAVHQSLEPFVKQRQEVTQIRRVLALHLGSHVNPKDGLPVSQLLSLLESGCDVGSTSSGLRGIRREYLRCVRANIKAREEYEKISREHQLNIGPDGQHPKGVTRKNAHEDPGISLASFLDVVRYRRKHERLRILQDYLDMLAQKPAAAADHLDPQFVLKDVDPLPAVPSEVLMGTRPRQASKRTDLDELVDQLDKSVLRAKLLLKREQKLLAKVRSDGRSSRSTSTGSRLQALGTARNELINWIETELAKAGESSADSDNDQNVKSTEKRGKEYVDTQLISIQRQYAQYTKARQALIIAATRSLDKPPPTSAHEDADAPARKEEAEKTSNMSHVIHLYLEELTCVSNQQKSVIQQKSFLTISLAKQLKEAGQGLDRLAEESHLLPAYPWAGSQHKGMENSTSFAEEISNHEKPDSSHKARAWVHVSELASKATKDVIAEKLEEGEIALSDSRQTLLDLESLLGEDVDTRNESKKDIWASLDGHLGVITRDGDDL
jgi:hypothetical protein